ncbi:MAG TPA: SDR family NAD(P)-dependent oxidoreductase [Chthoniobacterales bacterium]|nr:SDR family NAD(P)-dependent oxidoreductase [Chthoniobacterales bacterium]
MRWFISVLILVFGGCIASRVYRSRFSFQDKVALISGGSRGLGLVLARQICDEGGRVAILARDPDALARARSDLSARSGEALTLQCDLHDRGQIESAVQQTLERFGRIDILINNAGIIEVGPFEHMSREDFERCMGIHFWAPLELIMQVIPAMRRQRGGRIVNISSIGGKIAVPHLAAYCASKFALTGLSDSLRAELARENIYVTTVAPGLMRTGSHVNAKFKGKHDAEFAWFSVSAGAPLISMNAERAARKILAASRRGQPSLTLTFAARGAIVGNALFPNLTGYVMKLANRFLPGTTGDAGNESRRGGDVPRLAPEWVTHLADRAIEKNNESCQ